MKNLAIIPARSGSKGLKDKNIKLLNGKPLLAYSIEAAKDSGIFDEVMVSTDSEKYAEIARSWGADVPFLRTEILSNDSASSWDVVKEVIENYRLLGMKFDTVCLLQPTSPLRTCSDIIEGYNIMKDKSANLVVAVCEMDHSPLWANLLPEDHSMSDFMKPEVVGMPRQNIPTFYRINGALYIIKTDFLLSSKDIYSNRSYALVMDKIKSVDIDDEFDFVIAEAIYTKHLNSKLD